MVHLVSANQNIHIIVCIYGMFKHTVSSADYTALVCMNTFLLELQNNHVLVRHKQSNRSVKNISIYIYIYTCIYIYI
jgi:hypothetical protein